MRTRCPACSTVFRVTSEQLRLKAGKVRCGQCQTLFNAFDQLVMESVPPPEPSPSTSPEAIEAPARPVAPVQTIPAGDGGRAVPADYATEPTSEPHLEPEPKYEPEPAPKQDEPREHAAEVEAEPPLSYDSVPSHAFESPHEPESEPGDSTAASEMPQEAPTELPPVGRLAEGDSAPETPEESTRAAREVGLVAVRELDDIAGHNRWAAGTLAGSGLGGFDSEQAPRAVWPFVLFLALLVVLLLGQLLYHFRTDVVQHLPGAAAWYEMAGADVPLPRHAELVAIETSDLQSDNQRGLFVLQATLRNRAPYAQAWPALELALTDTRDAVVSRRVLAPADYLPPAAPPEAFPANGEIAVRLWIEARDIGAAGYRLYVFYP